MDVTAHLAIDRVIACIARINKYYDTSHVATKLESPLASLQTVLADLQISALFQARHLITTVKQIAPFSLGDACIPYGIGEGETDCGRAVAQTVISFFYVVATNSRNDKTTGSSYTPANVAAVLCSWFAYRQREYASVYTPPDYKLWDRPHEPFSEQQTFRIAGQHPP